MVMKRESIQKRIRKRLEEIAIKERVEPSEALKVFRSQFLFAKTKIESIEKEWLRTASEEELKELVFNFIYIGKIHSNKLLQKFGNKKNNFKGENDE